MGAVFISYRREDTAAEARMLHKDLSASIGIDSVFIDVDSIELGQDFREALQKRLDSCDIMLALIGDNWLDSKNESGKRRLDDSGDVVRQEIAAALKRDIPVTPVLLQGAQMPSEDELPKDLKNFAYRNGFELSHQRWESDFQEMIKRLGFGSGQEPAAASGGTAAPKSNEPAAVSGPTAAPKSKKKYWLWIVIAVILVLAALYQLGLI